MDFTNILSGIADSMQVKFVFDGKPLSTKEFFADNGFLPNLARRADGLCLLCFGYGIGASFVETDKSTLGVKVRFDEATPNVLRIAFFYDVLTELVAASSDKNNVEVDDLVYD